MPGVFRRDTSSRFQSTTELPLPAAVARVAPWMPVGRLVVDASAAVAPPASATALVNVATVTAILFIALSPIVCRAGRRAVGDPHCRTPRTSDSDRVTRRQG